MLVLNPELNWGVNIYAPNGDLIDQKPGLIKVRTGGVRYSLQEDPHDHQYSLTTQPVDSPNSKIFYGYPGSMFKAWALTTNDRPFVMGDTDRINQSIVIIKKLVDIDQTRLNSSRIDEIGDNYRRSLAMFFGQVPLDIIRRIAVLEDELKNLTGSSRFNTSFLEIADQMEELGLAEILAESMDTKAREKFFSVTPAWFHQFYGQQAA